VLINLHQALLSLWTTHNFIQWCDGNFYGGYNSVPFLMSHVTYENTDQHAHMVKLFWIAVAELTPNDVMILLRHIWKTKYFHDDIFFLRWNCLPAPIVITTSINQINLIAIDHDHCKVILRTNDSEINEKIVFKSLLELIQESKQII
jgi:hypothetical protein